MRNDGFLRTPVRSDHQDRMKNLEVLEVPPSGNPNPQTYYPQSLAISFEIEEETKEIQISPLWEGFLYFFAKDVALIPTDLNRINESNFPDWPVVGDMVLLTTSESHEHAFHTHVSFISVAPSTVRYSEVRLTLSFMFTTLRKTSDRLRFLWESNLITKSDPKWFEKFVISFLRGRAGLWCPLDANDATLDFAHNPMPSVNLQPLGETTTFHVAIATRQLEVLDTSWFDQREYDNLSGEVLVNPTLATLRDQFYNPAHPSHSVFPGLLLFQNAAAAAYAPEHGALTPLRAALSAPRPDGKVYRRIDLVRSDIYTSSNPQRPFPMYQLAWQPMVGGDIESLRIPLNGRLYLALYDSDYKFWAIPTSQDPKVLSTGEQLKLSVKTPLHRYIDLPGPTIIISFAVGERLKKIYADLLDYDSKQIWTALIDLGQNFVAFKAAAEARWNVDVLNLFIRRSANMADYAPVYGLIRVSADRHGLAPEFLHAVFMGEGVGAEDGLIERNRKAVPRIAYDRVQLIDSFVSLGLDDIQSDLNILINDHYLDPSFSGVLKNQRSEIRHEAGGDRTIQVFDVEGWEAAIEIVAAELHWRLDKMLDYCKTKRIPITTEEQRRFLAYIRFNTAESDSKRHIDHLDTELKKWTSPRPTSNLSGRYNTLQRIAIAEWYEAAGVYR
jgi:hypothetical protein